MDKFRVRGYEGRKSKTMDPLYNMHLNFRSFLSGKKCALYTGKYGIHNLPSRFSTVLPVQCHGYRDWSGFLVGRAHGLSLQVGQVLRSSSYLGLGSAVPAPMFLATQPPYGT